MSKFITMTDDGTSSPILLESSHDGSTYWNAVVYAASWAGSLTVTLEVSPDNTNWFTANDGTDDVVFTRSSIKLVSSGLYYRIVVSNYGSSPVTFTMRQT